MDREYTSSSQGSSFHIYQKKCAQLRLWVKKAQEVKNQSNTCDSTAGEFCAARERANYLVEECSHDLWLLKAVELWECEEHFVEVLLDLFRSAYIMSLGVGNIEGSEKWMNLVKELLNSRTEQNAMTRLFPKDCSMVDRGDLKVMVEAKLADKNLAVDSPEHELGQLLRDRLGNTKLWQPQFLRRHSFNIYCKIIFPSERSSRTGASGAILTLGWVYGNKFALKTRCRGSDGKVTFEREFDILDKYRSPYIVGVVGYWELDVRPIPLISRTVPYPFLLMEILECNLKDLIHKCKRSRDQGSREGFSALDTINLMLPVAKALRFVHQKDVAHRDVKPENIMCKNVNIMNPKDLNVIKEDVVVKLIDFGEARESVSKIPDGKWGRAGTSGYMDPTMWNQDAKKYSLRMGDVFSFAMTFAELLTWRSPWEAFGVPTPKDAQDRLKEGERPSLPHDSRIPRYLKFIVESCWDADHLRRPDFTDICSRLQSAKESISEHKNFDCEHENIFLYDDAHGLGPGRQILKDLIHKCKRFRDQGSREGFSALETIYLMLPVAKALWSVHEKDVAHRDVKPENIMCKNVNIMNLKDRIVIKEDVVVELIDFGEPRESVLKIPDGKWGRAGTSGYMDPTMWNQGAVGYTLFMGDVFSFAMTFAELLTWRSPSEAFGVPTLKDAQDRLKAGERPSLPHDSRIPRYLKFIVESCWDADHLRRPDFTDICSMLQHAKVLLSEHNDFDCKLEDIFLYEDAQGFERCIISDET